LDTQNTVCDTFTYPHYLLGYIQTDAYSMIDYYGVTFDHLVPPDDPNPEVLQINIVEIEDDAGLYAIKCNNFEIDPADYIGKQVLGAPRCCSKRRGTTDRIRVNESVNERLGRMTQMGSDGSGH